MRKWIRELPGVCAVVACAVLQHFYGPVGDTQLAFFPLLAFVGGALSGMGQRGQQRRQNKILRKSGDLLKPGAVAEGAGTMNPYLNTAMQQPGFQSYLSNIASNPGYIPPQLMNMPLMQADRGALQAQMYAQGQMGRSGMQGGIGSLIPMAAQAGRTANRVGIMGRFGELSTQLGRQDIFNLLNQQFQQQQLAGQLASNRANILSQRKAPTPWTSIAGNAIQGGLTAYGMSGFGGGGGMFGAGMNNPSSLYPWWSQQRPGG